MQVIVKEQWLQQLPTNSPLDPMPLPKSLSKKSQLLRKPLLLSSSLFFRNNTEEIAVSKLNIIDLAGSERGNVHYKNGTRMS
jgi:hypothetical protein